jgi:hypothetical protein
VCCILAARVVTTYDAYVQSGPYLSKGQRGPDPGRQISRGGIFKKIEIELWYAGEKKGLSTIEKFKGDIY